MKRTTSKKHLRMTLHKNLYRTIRHSYKRFFAIMLMTLLGASVLLSLVSTGPNMRLAVQQPIQSSYREDLRVHSPLGLEPEDTLYLSSLEQVARWEAYKQADYLLGDTDRVFRLQSLSSAVSLPELVSGRLPASSQEIVLDAALMKHYSIGDTITLNTPDTDEGYSLLPDHTLQHPTMTVIGFVHHIHYLAASRYGTSQVGDGTVDAFGFTTPDNFKEDTVDGVMLRIKGLDAYNTHDALYEQHILQWTHDLESHFKARTKHRTAKTIDELQEKIQDSEEQVENGEQALQEGEQKLADAHQELEKNQQEWSAQNQSFQKQMADAEKELQDKQRLIEEKQAEWDDGQNKLNYSLQVWQDKKNSFDQKKDEWEASYSSLEDGEKELQEAEAAFTQFGIQPIATETLDSMLQAIQRSIDALEEQLERIREALLLYPDDPALQEQYAILEEQVQALESKAEQLESMRPQIEIYLEKKESLAQARTMLEAAKSQLDAAEEQLQEGKIQLDAQQQRLDEAKQSLEQGQQTYKEGVETLQLKKEEGETQLEEAKAQLDAATEELATKNSDFQEQKKKTTQELQEAKEAIAEQKEQIRTLQLPQYNIDSRLTDYSIHTLLESSDNIDALAMIFPVVFYAIAMLITLTTITRMVEEERLEIGTMSALGIPRGKIIRKYLLYAGSASFLGSILGCLLGFYVLMPVIFNAYTAAFTLYTTMHFQVVPWHILLTLCVGVGLSLLTAWFCAQHTVRQHAASLFVPPTPNGGNRVLLERIPFLWKRFRFITKITIRNLTAKKSRMLMTIIGVFGGTALIILGYGLRDSIMQTTHKQFQDIQRETMQIIYNPSAQKEDLDALHQLVGKESDKFTQIYVTSGSFQDQKGVQQDVSLFVADDESSLQEFRPLRDLWSKTALSTENGPVLSFQMHRYVQVHDHAFSFRDARGYTFSIPEGQAAENYMGHFLYLSKAQYEEIFAKTWKANTYLIQLKHPENIAAFKETVLKNPAVHFTVSREDIQSIVDNLLHAMNIVVWVILIISTLLSFVVLYNLTNLNISERLRELSTIKVLGFTPWESTQYIYRETFFLTVFGILLGLVGGKILHFCIVFILSPTSVLIDPALQPMAYLLSAVLICAFSLLVMFLVQRHLRHVNMVEALKAAE